MSSVLLAACATGEEGPREPLVMEPGRGEPAPINLDLPRDPSGAFAFDRWPKACDLLTDADIKAVLPQTTKVKRESRDQRFEVIPDFSDNAVPEPPRTATAKGADCTYQLQLPAAGLQDRHDIPDTSGASLLVSVHYAGTPKAVKRNFSGDTKADRIEVPHGRCYVDENSAGVSCRKESLAFSIRSSFDHLVSGVNSENRRWIDRYRVNGKILS